MIAARDVLSEFVRNQREALISKDPFVVRRAVRWSECDPAGVVYTGFFTEYLMSAVQFFWRDISGGNWSSIRQKFGVDTPAKASSLIYRGTLWPDDVFDVEMSVGDIRRRTFDFAARATRADTAAPVFDGKFTMICVDAADRKRSVEIPAPLRKKLETRRGAGCDREMRDGQPG